MKYTIEGFSQEEAIRLGLDVKDLVLLRWMVDFCGTGIMESLRMDGEKYYWFDYGYMLQNLPILHIQSVKYLGKRLREISMPRDVGIKNHAAPPVLSLKIIPTSDGTRMYFRFIPEIMENLLTSKPGVKKEQWGWSKKSSGGGLKTLPLYDSSINDSSINDSIQPRGKSTPAPIVEKPVENSKTIHSRCFVDKAGFAKSKGFNIFQMTNRFYKQSKLREQLPESVLEAVLDEFIGRNGNASVNDPWPYFLTVLKEQSERHFAARNEREGERLKKAPAAIGNILAGMARHE